MLHKFGTVIQDGFRRTLHEDDELAFWSFMNGRHSLSFGAERDLVDTGIFLLKLVLAIAGFGCGYD